MNEYYVFWWDRELNRNCVTSIGKLSSRGLRLFIDAIVKNFSISDTGNSGTFYTLDESDNIQFPTTPDRYVIQKRKESYTTEEQTAIDRSLIQDGTTAMRLRGVAGIFKNSRDGIVATEEYYILCTKTDYPSCYGTPPGFLDCDWRNRNLDCKGCPRGQSRNYSKASLGRLTATEKAAFIELSTIRRIPDFKLCVKEDMSNKSLVEKTKYKMQHDRLVERYETDCEALMNEGFVALVNGANYVRYIEGYKQLADEIRQQRDSSLWTVDRKPEPAPRTFDTIPIHVSAAASGNGRQIIPTEIYGEYDLIEEPEEKSPTVKVDGLEKTLDNVLGKYFDPKHEKEAERWDRLSREKFNGAGWAELAKEEIKIRNLKETKSSVRTWSDKIRNAVERHRGNK